MQLLLRKLIVPAVLLLLGVVARPLTAQECDRGCLEGLMDQVLEAMLVHDASGLPLNPTFRYTENGQDIDVDDGLWMTYSKHSDYKLYVSDPFAGQLAFLSVIEEGQVPLIAHFRMKVVNQTISELEVLIGRASMAKLENLKSPKPIFLDTLAPSQRSSRAEMVRISNAYFSGIDEENSGANVPFDPDCQRQENGNVLANNPDAPAGSMQRLGCKAQFDTGFSTIVTDIRERRFMVLDEERGLSYAIVFFDHNGTPKKMGTADGSSKDVGPPFNRPLTFMIGELFKIVDGNIRQIEAIIVTVPYSMPSGWQGEDLVSMGQL